MKTIGFRYVELVQDDVSDGKTFYFKINGTYILRYMCFVHTHISIYTYYAYPTVCAVESMVTMAM